MRAAVFAAPLLITNTHTRGEINQEAEFWNNTVSQLDLIDIDSIVQTLHPTATVPVFVEACIEYSAG